MEPIQNYKDLTARASVMTADQKQSLQKIYTFSVMDYVEQSIRCGAMLGYSQADIAFPSDVMTYGGGPFSYVDNGIDRIVATVLYSGLEPADFSVLVSEIQARGYVVTLTLNENKINVNWA